MGLKLSLTYGEFVDSEATALEGLGIKRAEFYRALENVHGVPVTVRGVSGKSLEEAQQDADKKMEERAKDFDVVVEVSTTGGGYSRNFECVMRGLGLKVDYKRAFNERDFEDAVQENVQVPAGTVLPKMIGISNLGNLMVGRQVAVYTGNTSPVQSAFLDTVAKRFERERVNHYYTGPWGNHPEIEQSNMKFEYAVLISEWESLSKELAQEGGARNPTQQELDSRRELAVRKIRALLGPQYTPVIERMDNNLSLQNWRIIFRPEDFIWSEAGHSEYGTFGFGTIREEVQKAQQENRVLTITRLRSTYEKALDRIKREEYLGDRQHFFDRARKTVGSDTPRAVRKLSPEAPASVREALRAYGRKVKDAPEVSPEEARKRALLDLERAEMEIVGMDVVLKEMGQLSEKIGGGNRDLTEDEIKAVYRARDAKLKAHYRRFESQRTDVGPAMEIYRTVFRPAVAEAEKGEQLRSRGSESYDSAIARVSGGGLEDTDILPLASEFGANHQHPKSVTIAIERYAKLATSFFGNFGARILPWSWTRSQVRTQCLNELEDAREDLYTDSIWSDDLSELAIRTGNRNPTTEELLESWVSARRKTIERYFPEASAGRLTKKLRKEEAARRKDPNFRRQAIHKYQEVLRKYAIVYDPNEPVNTGEAQLFPGSSGIFPQEMVEGAITGASSVPRTVRPRRPMPVRRGPSARQAMNLSAEDAAKLRRQALMGGGSPPAGGPSEVPLQPDEISYGQNVHLRYRAALDSLVDQEHAIGYLSEENPPVPHPDNITSIVRDFVEGAIDQDSAHKKLAVQEVNENLGFCVAARARRYFTEIGSREPDVMRLVEIRRESIVHGWAATVSPHKYSREELDTKIKAYDRQILNEDGSLRADEAGRAEQGKIVAQFKRFGRPPSPAMPAQ